MVSEEKIIELINKIPYIKTKFYLSDFKFYSSYSIKTRRRETSSMQIKMIYKDPEFMLWRDNLIMELAQLNKDEFIGEIIHELKSFVGWGDVNRFERVESKLKTLYKKVNEYVKTSIEKEISDDRLPESELVKNVLGALARLQRNHTYNSSSSENEMNDFVRDILDVSYETKDQTRQGESEGGDDAGEVDVQILLDGFPVVMLEGLIMKSLLKKYLENHIEKVFIKYDPNGCPYVVVMIYFTGVRFHSFCQKLIEYLEEYGFPFKRESEIIDVDTGYAELKHLQVILRRNDKRVRLHIFATHIV